VQSVERAIALLEAVAHGPHPASVSELAAQVGLNRSTAWRLLATLERHGLVERDPISQRFDVGYATIRLADSADHDALVRRARPIMEKLALETNETVTLAVATSLSLLYVDQVDPPSIMTPSWLGRPIPLHATSAGKVFLAWLPEVERGAVLPQRLERYTPMTITDGAKLDEELAEIRRAGYGLCIGEYEEFSNGVSAAVQDHRARPIAIVNVWGPSQRLSERRLPELGRMALTAARKIAETLDR
jgi:DNA-binding IclR family transcriptional regulator